MTRHDFSHHDLSGQVYYRVVETHNGKEYPRLQVIAWYNKYWRVNTGVPAEIAKEVARAVHDVNERAGLPAKASTVRNLIVDNLLPR